MHLQIFFSTLLREGFCLPYCFHGRTCVCQVIITGGLLSALSFSQEGFCPPCHFWQEGFCRGGLLTYTLGSYPASLRNVGGSTQVPVRARNNTRKGTWGLPPPVKLECRNMTDAVSMWCKPKTNKQYSLYPPVTNKVKRVYNYRSQLVSWSLCRSDSLLGSRTLTGVLNEILKSYLVYSKIMLRQSGKYCFWTSWGQGHCY
jgi:hypothetical protein